MNYSFSDKISSLKPSAIREILKFTADPKVISFAAGNPATEAFPIDKVAKITADIFNENPIEALQYSITEGHTQLRNHIIEMMRVDYNQGSIDDNLIIVSGAQQGVELTCKCFCNEQDIIICENPSFIGSLNSFRSYNTKLVGVEIEDDGISIEKLEQSLKSNKNVKLIYVIPNFQNPTGLTMSLEKRKAVLALAEKYNVVILEDNPYGDLRFEGENIPSIKSLDTKGIVVYCGSFSKTLSPGLRVGFVQANKEIISKITVAKQGSDVHSNILAQIITYKFITEYDYKAHLSYLRQIYKNKSKLMLDLINEKFPKEVTHSIPQGGLFIWCTLPLKCSKNDMIDFCTLAVKKGVAVVPGNAFIANENDYTNSFRMNFSTPNDENIIKGIDILSDILKEFLNNK